MCRIQYPADINHLMRLAVRSLIWEVTGSNLDCVTGYSGTVLTVQLSQFRTMTGHYTRAGETGVRIPVGAGDFLIPKTCRPTLEPSQPLLQWGKAAGT